MSCPLRANGAELVERIEAVDIRAPVVEALPLSRTRIAIADEFCRERVFHLSERLERDTNLCSPTVAALVNLHLGTGVPARVKYLTASAGTNALRVGNGTLEIHDDVIVRRKVGRRIEVYLETRVKPSLWIVKDALRPLQVVHSVVLRLIADNNRIGSTAYGHRSLDVFGWLTPLLDVERTKFDWLALCGVVDERLDGVAALDIGIGRRYGRVEVLAADKGDAPRLE